MKSTPSQQNARNRPPSSPASRPCAQQARTMRAECERPRKRGNRPPGSWEAAHFASRENRTRSGNSDSSGLKFILRHIGKATAMVRPGHRAAMSRCLMSQSMTSKIVPRRWVSDSNSACSENRQRRTIRPLVLAWERRLQSWRSSVAPQPAYQGIPKQVTDLPARSASKPIVEDTTYTRSIFRSATVDSRARAG